MRLAALLSMLVLLVSAVNVFAQGRAYCPRVTSEHNADTTELSRFRNFHLWKEKSGNELAIAVWQYLCGYETGVYHFECLYEGPDPFGEYSQNTNPVKLLNVYNQGYCATLGPMLDGIFHGIGFEQGRIFSVSKPGHTATEIFYDGSWHYFDIDVRGCCIKDDGKPASLEEIRQNPDLMAKCLDKSPNNFPHYNTPDKAVRLGRDYKSAAVDYGFRWWTGSHTTDWMLRPGESFTRWWDDKTGRWNHRPEYNKFDWLKQKIMQKPVGMKPNHREFSKWNHGGGLFHYEPKLAAGSGDFDAGVYSQEAAKLEAGGLRLSGGKGQAVFQVWTPFIIVPKVNDMLNFDDDAEAALVELKAGGPVAVDVSTDFCQSWTEAGTAESGKKLDLTKLVKEKYGYFIRFRPAGKDDVVIQSLALDTWVQVAPVSLPRLMKGGNKLRYDCGDRYGQPTMPLLLWPNAGDPEDLKKYVVEMPKRYNPTQNLARIQGEVILKLEAPPGAKIAWFDCGGGMNTLQGEQAPNTANTIGYAVGKPEDFKEIYKSKNPDWINHWRYNYDTTVKLDQPAEKVYVRYFGRPGVNTLRACAHLAPAVKHDPAVVITHGFELDGKPAEKVVELAQPGDYTVECAGEKVENVFIKVAKPSK